MAAPDFETVVNLHYADLYRFAYSLARNPDDACDLTQQTFAIFAEKGRQIREAERAKSWLFTTLYREFLRNQQRNKRMVASDDVPPDVAEPVVESDVESRSEAAEVLSVLSSLEDDQRAILGLFYLQQHSYKEIAAILKLPMGTVMSRLSRAKEVLREKLENTGVWSGIKKCAQRSNLKDKDRKNG